MKERGEAASARRLPRRGQGGEHFEVIAADAGIAGTVARGERGGERRERSGGYPRYSARTREGLTE